MNYCIFDIETAVNKNLLLHAFGDQLLLGLDRTEINPDTQQPVAISEENLAEMAYQEYRNRGPNGLPPMVPLPCQNPIRISYGQVNNAMELTMIDGLSVDPVGVDELVYNFWERFEKFQGMMVSFNGRSFDLPLLELHAMRLGIEARSYMAQGRDRYHASRHIDLLDKMTNYGAVRMYQFRGGLDLLSWFIGAPPKGLIHGSQVQEYFEAGEHDLIAHYCDQDVLRTYLLFLRWHVLMGNITGDRMRELSVASMLKYGSDG